MPEDGSMGSDAGVGCHREDGAAGASDPHRHAGGENMLIPPPSPPPPPPHVQPPALPSAVPQLMHPLTIVVARSELPAPPEDTGKASSQAVVVAIEELSMVASPKKGHLSRSESSHEQCRVCQQEKEEMLIELGCLCRGGIAKAHRSCIDTWFRSKGSNKCEICQQPATNVSPPASLPTGNSWIWSIDPAVRGTAIAEERRTCFSPLWVAFTILIGGLLLDVLISVTLGISALPVNIIIGVIVVLGLGTALRLALEFCHEWSLRRVVQRVETNVNLGYHPAL